MFHNARQGLRAVPTVFQFWVVVLPACLFAAAIGAAGATGPHATAELIAEPTSVQPGQPFWLGLHFQLEPGWHIYWTNPGDSGEPPQIKWQLPPGYQASSLHWPIPQRIEDHSLVDYGYQNEVLLPAEIKPPLNIGDGPSVQLGATVHWLACREICVPGRASLALTLPVGKATDARPSPTHSLFVKTLAALPRPAPRSWKVTANLRDHWFVLNVDTGERETGATFFPLEPNQIENASPQKASPSARGLRLELQKSDQLLKAPLRLSGVLVLPSGQGYVIEPLIH
jgi:thiol:disulfide interchange protein DsbD